MTCCYPCSKHSDVLMIGACDHLVCEAHTTSGTCPVCGVAGRWRTLDLCKSRKACLLGRNFQDILKAGRVALSCWAKNVTAKAQMDSKDNERAVKDLEISRRAAEEMMTRLATAEKENQSLRMQSKQAQRELLKLEGYSASAKRQRTCIPDSTPFMTSNKPVRAPVTPFVTNWSGQVISSDISKRLFRQR